MLTCLARYTVRSPSNETKQTRQGSHLPSTSRKKSFLATYSGFPCNTRHLSYAHSRISSVESRLCIRKHLDLWPSLLTVLMLVVGKVRDRSGFRNAPPCTLPKWLFPYIERCVSVCKKRISNEWLPFNLYTGTMGARCECESPIV